MTPQTICMWSGPRNLSTAMMRSFENRADCAVWDEPFFAPFLAVSGKAHPGREETLAAHETDPDKVAKACAELPPESRALYFQKHMPHHMLAEFDRDWMAEAKHFMLIRHPAAVIRSYAKGRAAFDASDIGLIQQLEFFDLISDFQSDIPIVDSGLFLQNPEGQLRALCKDLGIPFDRSMLSWPSGSRDSDGAWAPYWYKSVEASTGFGPPGETPETIDAKYQGILDAVLPAYERLRARALNV